MYVYTTHTHIERERERDRETERQSDYPHHLLKAFSIRCANNNKDTWALKNKYLMCYTTKLLGSFLSINSLHVLIITHNYNQSHRCECKNCFHENI